MLEGWKTAMEVGASEESSLTCSQIVGGIVGPAYLLQRFFFFGPLVSEGPVHMHRLHTLSYAPEHKNSCGENVYINHNERKRDNTWSQSYWQRRKGSGRVRFGFAEDEYRKSNQMKPKHGDIKGPYKLLITN